MSPSKKTLVAGVLCTVFPILLLLADEKLFNCTDQTWMFPLVLGFVDKAIDVSVLAIPFGLLSLFASVVLRRREQGKSVQFIIYESILLLFLMALIGSLVLATQNTARSKGQNSAVKGIVLNVRASAVTYYDTHEQTYAGFCSSQNISDLTLYHVPKQGLVCNIPTYNFVCNDSKDSYAASVKLPNQYNDKEMYFCVDSGGVAKETESPLIGTSCK